MRASERGKERRVGVEAVFWRETSRDNRALDSRARLERSPMGSSLILCLETRARYEWVKKKMETGEGAEEVHYGC